MRSNRERLLDMQEAIERIQRHTGSGRRAFDEDELIQTWVIHHLQIIGEAARGVSPLFMAEHAEIAWKEIIGMRNILVHNYFGIDRAIAWRAVENALPQLKAQVERLLQDPTVE